MDIREFLIARLDEDEQNASEKHDRIDCDLGALQTYGECSCGYPARVLADIAAKRRVLKRHGQCGTGVGWCDDGGLTGGCYDLLDLAAPYADHADFDPSWTA